jgi:hypothetical protein
VDAWGYPTLTLLAALATVPLILLVSITTFRRGETGVPL